MPFAVWLLPDDDDSVWLAERIRALAATHGAPAFEPHITLHVGQCDPHADIASALTRAARAARAGSEPRLALTAGPTGESAAYFKALFITIATATADGEPLSGLRRRVVEELLKTDTGALRYAPSAAASALDQALAAYRLEPHLTLLYGKLPREERRRLARDNDLRGRRIGFTRIAAVRPAPGHEGLAAVDGWQVFGHCPLGV